MTRGTAATTWADLPKAQQVMTAIVGVAWYVHQMTAHWALELIGLMVRLMRLVPR